MSKSLIYDFETLGTDLFKKPVVLALSAIEFDDDEFTQADLSYFDYLKRAKFIKFDVTDQVKNHGRKIEKDTLNFWKEQGDTAKHLVEPSQLDVSINELPKYWKENFQSPNSYKRVYTRGNFDPFLLSTLPGGDIFPFWVLRDTRSIIDGMLIGEDLENGFFPPTVNKDDFIHHHPSHDIALDIMRIQYLYRGILS